MVAREGWAPVGENPDQLAAIEVTLDLLLREIRQPKTLQSGIHQERRRVTHKSVSKETVR